MSVFNFMRLLSTNIIFCSSSSYFALCLIYGSPLAPLFDDPGVHRPFVFITVVVLSFPPPLLLCSPPAVVHCCIFGADHPSRTTPQSSPSFSTISLG